MPVFAVFIRDRTTNPAELEIYSKKAGASTDGHPITVRAFYGKQEVLEGPPSEGTVILEFPTMRDAKAWYNSPAYQEAKVHRVAGSDYRVIFVEGVEPAKS